MNHWVHKYESNVGERCVDIRRFVNFLHGGARRIVPQLVESYKGPKLSVDNKGVGDKGVGDGQRRGIKRGIEQAYYRALQNQYPDKPDDEIMAMVENVHALDDPLDQPLDHHTTDNVTTDLEVQEPPRVNNVNNVDDSHDTSPMTPLLIRGVNDRIDFLKNRIDQLERRMVDQPHHARPPIKQHDQEFRVRDQVRAQARPYQVKVVQRSEPCQEQDGYTDSRIRLKDPNLKKCKKLPVRKRYDRYVRGHPGVSFDEYKRRHAK